MLSLAGTMESSMSKAGLDNRHRNHDGEISHKHGNTLIGTLRKIYGQSFAAGYPATEKLSEVLDPAARFSRSRSPQQRSVLARKPVNSEQVSCSLVPTSVVQRALVDGECEQPIHSDMSVVEGIVLQKSKIERPRKSCERSFLDISTAAEPASGLTFPKGGFLVHRSRMRSTKFT